MDASLDLRAGDFFGAAGGFFDRVIARPIVPYATCQLLRCVVWNGRKDRLPEESWDAKFQFTVIHRNLARIGDLDRILAVLL